MLGERCIKETASALTLRLQKEKFVDTMHAEGFSKSYPRSVPRASAIAGRELPEHTLLDMSSEDREMLSRWSEGEDARRRVRAQLILLSAQGLGADEVAEKLQIALPTVYKWLRRFSRAGLSGLSDLPRSGQPHRLPKEKREEILRVTLEERPPSGERWTIRVAARHLGVTQHQIRQVWSDAGVRPHQIVSLQIEA